MDHPNVKKPRRRGYRLNKKKFAGMLLALSFIIVTAAVAVKIYEDASAGYAEAQGKGDIGAIAVGSGVPQNASNAAASKPAATKNAAEKDNDGKLCVVVDAGHGGFDPGAIGANGTHEADVNLEVAKKLKKELENRGAQVIMTRENDDGLGNTQQESLKERRRLIQESGADMVISIHMNSFDDKNVSGPLVLFGPGSQRGKEFADTVQQSLNDALETDGTARSQDLVVVQSIDEPSILVECGYITNPKEEKNLKKPEYQDKIVKAICNGVDDYRGKGSDS
jgi:N-acetylmuramoyl-L-alanine amidase